MKHINSIKDTIEYIERNYNECKYALGGCLPFCELQSLIYDINYHCKGCVYKKKFVIRGLIKRSIR